MSNLPTAQTKRESPPVETELVVLDEQQRKAAVLWLNRPDSLNAISWDAMRCLAAGLEAAEKDPAVRAVLIIGRGRGFSAGGDIKAYKKLQADAEAFTAFVDDYCRLTEGIAEMTKPVLALVNGLCAAGGLELLLACDFAWAAESARIGDMHVNFAQIGGAGAMARLPQHVPPEACVIFTPLYPVHNAEPTMRRVAEEQRRAFWMGLLLCTGYNCFQATWTDVNAPVPRIS